MELYKVKIKLSAFKASNPIKRYNNIECCTMVLAESINEAYDLAMKAASARFLADDITSYKLEIISIKRKKNVTTL